jgi:hypothetical protein
VCISREALRNIMSVINTDNTAKAGSTTGGTSTAAGSDEGLDTTEDPWCDPPAYKVREGCGFAGCTVTSTSLLCWTSCCVSGAPRLTLVLHLLLCYYLFVRAVLLLRLPFRVRSSMARRAAWVHCCAILTPATVVWRCQHHLVVL